MPTNPNPLPKWSDAQKEYWQRHLELIAVLAQIGPRLAGTSRLDLFWLRNRLRVVYDEADPELLRSATSLIDELVVRRTYGGEPGHKNGKYI